MSRVLSDLPTLITWFVFAMRTFFERWKIITNLGENSGDSWCSGLRLTFLKFRFDSLEAAEQCALIFLKCMILCHIDCFDGVHVSHEFQGFCYHLTETKHWSERIRKLIGSRPVVWQEDTEPRWLKDQAWRILLPPVQADQRDRDFFQECKET